MNSDIEKRIRCIISNHIDISVPIDNVGPDDDLTDIGLNSISYIKLVVLLEKEFDFEFNDNELNVEKYKTISSVVNAIESHLKKK